MKFREVPYALAQGHPVRKQPGPDSELVYQKPLCAVLLGPCYLLSTKGSQWLSSKGLQGGQYEVTRCSRVGLSQEMP